jgi:uncharacterized damage-inducible protein DinB
MKRLIGTMLLAGALATCLPRLAHADDAKLRADVVANMMDAGNKVIELAGAMPDKKYDWRPGKGVRSVNEVLLHVVGGNYMLPTMLGASTGKSMDELMKLEKTTPGKAEVEKMLKESYEVASKAITGVPDSEMDTQVDFFGTKMSKRALMLLIASHSHEHLGQMIAYARVNGVTPPWTAREQAAAKKAAGEKKTAGGM